MTYATESIIWKNVIFFFVKVRKKNLKKKIFYLHFMGKICAVDECSKENRSRNFNVYDVNSGFLIPKKLNHFIKRIRCDEVGFCN